MSVIYKSYRQSQISLLRVSDAESGVVNTQQQQQDVVPVGIFGKGSIMSSVSALTSATLGAGALSVPIAFKLSGVLLGLVFCLLIALLSGASSMSIVHVMKVTKLNSMEEMALNIGGHKFAVFTELCVITFCFGTAIGYLKSLGDLATTVFSSLVTNPSELMKVLMSPPVVLCVATVTLLMPLSLTDKINDLRFTSFIGISALFYLTTVVLVQFVSDGIHPSIPSAEAAVTSTSFMGVVQGFALLTFAYACQPNVPAVYDELKPRTGKRMLLVTFLTFTVCSVVYITMGVCGYLLFGSHTNGNILCNFEDKLKTSWGVVIGFVGMAFTIMFAYPMNIFPCRASFEMMLFNNRTNGLYSNLIGIVTIVFSLLLAVVVPGIKLVFELVGCTSGAFAIFVLPGVFYLCSVPGSSTSWDKFFAIFLIVVGVVVSVVGTFAFIHDLVYSDGSN
eukprot:GHVR01079809.1.p1 GENE.GHVR01079809.1~~GHVR01079809.1.p1  ORF type:complete len:448 (+),score=78.86 GHVR01079809.1:157-1500(+)